MHLLSSTPVVTQSLFKVAFIIPLLQLSKLWIREVKSLPKSLPKVAQLVSHTRTQMCLTLELKSFPFYLKGSLTSFIRTVIICLVFNHVAESLNT